MSHRAYSDLPRCWRRPTTDRQPTFFPQPVEQLLADVRVTRDDLRRWKSLGWLSFDVDCAETLDLPQEKEIRFVRHLVVLVWAIPRLNDCLMATVVPTPSTWIPQPITSHTAG